MLYLFLQKSVELGLAQDGLPEEVVLVGAGAELFEVVEVVVLGAGVAASHKHVDNLLGLEGLLHGDDCLDGQSHLFLGFLLGFGVQAVVAVAAIGLGVVFAEVAQYVEASAG